MFEAGEQSGQTSRHQERKPQDALALSDPRMCTQTSEVFHVSVTRTSRQREQQGVHDGSSQAAILPEGFWADGGALLWATSHDALAKRTHYTNHTS